MVVFLIILAPVYVFVAATLLGKPRRWRTAGLVIALPLSLIALSVAGIWALGAALKWVVP